MTAPPPLNQDQEEPEKTPDKSWADWTLGEIASKASRVGAALLAGFKTAKDIITDTKEDKK